MHLDMLTPHSHQHPSLHPIVLISKCLASIICAAESLSGPSLQERATESELSCCTTRERRPALRRAGRVHAFRVCLGHRRRVFLRMRDDHRNAILGAWNICLGANSFADYISPPLTSERIRAREFSIHDTECPVFTQTQSHPSPIRL